MTEQKSNAITRLIDTMQVQRRLVVEQILELDPHMNNYIAKKCDLENLVFNIDSNINHYLEQL